VPYQDLGADYFERRNKAKALRRLTRRIEELGYLVEVKPAASPTVLCHGFFVVGRGRPTEHDAADAAR
jgi:hypothetical protein